MELTRVKAEDVFPSDANPRINFGDIDALAGSFAMNPTHPGEPLTPPLLVRDGQVYRIVDGERRFRAMICIGTTEFDAIVCDDWEDADAALAMLATDDKKALTDLERSRGVQRALLLGVEPDRVEKATRRKGMKHVKRGIEIVGDEAECMTLDHLAAIAEFEDDQERSARIAAADERSWERVYKECREEVARDRAMAKLRKKAEELGINLLDDRPEYGVMVYAATCRTVEDLEGMHSQGVDYAYVIASSRCDGARVIVYEPVSSEEYDPVRDAARQLADKYTNMAENALVSLRDFLVGALMEGAYPTASMAKAIDKFMGDADISYSVIGRANEFVDSTGWEGPRLAGKATGMLGAFMLSGWLRSVSIVSSTFEYVTGARDGFPSWAREQVFNLSEVVSAAMKDEWEPDATFVGVVNLAKSEALAAAPADNEEEE